MTIKINTGSTTPATPPAPAVTITDIVIQTPTAPQAVNDIWEALRPLPNSYTSDYAFRMARAASVVKRPVPHEIVNIAQSSARILKDTLVASDTYAASPPGPPTGEFIEGGYTANDLAPGHISNLCLTARNNVMAFVLSVNSFVSRAKNAGFAPPNNPFVVIFSASEVGANGFVASDTLSSDLLANINVYSALIDAESKGQIDLQKHIVAAVQVSSMTLGTFGGTGNTSVDLAKLIPDADAIKRQKAEDLLAQFDFHKRVPKMLFTVNYNPQRESKGCIVGWKKIPDASGYKITRTSVFDGNVKNYVLSNDEINSRTSHLLDFLKVWVLSFYDTFDERLISCFLDSEIQPNQFYKYNVQAYQRAITSAESIFSVPTVPAILSVPQMNVMRAAMFQLQRTEFESEPDLISPYPIISKFLLGSSQYDWVLAGLNGAQSRARDDDVSITRKYSYVGAQMNFLFQQAIAGKLVIPAPGTLSQIVERVNSSIASFGVTSVIKIVLEETGALYYFDGHDSVRDNNFKRFEIDKIDSMILNAVFAAIDVENATLSLKAISTNMPQLLMMAQIDSGTKLTQAQPTQPTSQPTEIKVPANLNNTTETRSEDEVQFFREFNSDQVIDLVTFDGISKMMRAIRILSDISTNGRMTRANELGVTDQLKSLEIVPRIK